MANSDIDTALGDYITCFGTDEVTVWTARKKYQKEYELPVGSAKAASAQRLN